ncbi:hypothetical protein FQR65_LT10763 [Abscondita terminalis]|nr:hypothetical protein FQR65_LT10763 [Abscondita terminalis]
MFLPILSLLLIAGISSCKKIANGNNAEKGQFPFVGSYQYKGEHYCGCTIISNYWVLTAAHCIETTQRINKFDKQQLSIVAGITNLIIDDSQKQVRLVRKQFVHHGYNNKTLINDLGLIVVWSGFNFDNGVTNIKYSRKSKYPLMIVVGWGYLESSYEKSSPKLQYAIGHQILNEECNSVLISTLTKPIQVTYEMICIVGYKNQGQTTCNGDSGGPLLSFSDGYHLVGIISWDVKPCGLVGKPSVSTLIYPYLNWIDCISYYQNIEMCKFVSIEKN